jgi:hypothetical protein
MAVAAELKIASLVSSVNGAIAEASEKTDDMTHTTPDRCK